jgi:hypothetical protein
METSHVTIPVPPNLLPLTAPILLGSNTFVILSFLDSLAASEDFMFS